MITNYLNILVKTIQENWNQPALTDFYLTGDGTAQDTSRGNHYTYGEMYNEIVRVADYLERLGLQKGDHIAICGANSAHWVIAYLAIAKMQGVSVTIMHSLMPEQIAALVQFSDAKVLFTDEDIWAELQGQSMPQVQTIVSLADWGCLQSTTHRLITDSSPTHYRDVSFPHYESDSLAMICFTSGTEGQPKGVMLSYKNISCNWGALADERLFNKNYSQTNTISALPMAHMYGLLTELLYSLYYGKHLHILSSAIGMSMYSVCCRIIKPSIILLVPNVLEKLINNIRLHPEKGTLREYIYSLFGENMLSIVVGGAKIAIDLESILINSNLPIIFGYGSTECIRIAESVANTHRIGSAGKISNNIHARIAPNGEILVKGENVMLGYYKNPEATAQKIDADGWLHTGDRGYLDEDGYLYVEGRLEQDMIVLPNGENIHPDNIESKINALPEVAESIVIARGGNLVAIVVPSAVEHQDLRRFILRTINPQLPSYSQLYDVECINEPLARTAKQTLKRYLYK